MSYAGLYLLFTCIIICICIFEYINRNPYNPPKYAHTFDVSGKRNPNLDLLVRQYIQEEGAAEIENAYRRYREWRVDCKRAIKKLNHFRDLRESQFKQADHMTFTFQMTRSQTQYRQRNYQKYAYKVDVIVDVRKYTYGQLVELSEQQPVATNERSKMTKALREQIMERDNYTCQICGRSMPDGFGLHIDHIVPISKGGRSVPENLQVLCAKCNLSKSNK